MLMCEQYFSLIFITRKETISQNVRQTRRKCKILSIREWIMKPKINKLLAEQTKPTIRTVNNEVKILVNDDNIANVITETINKVVAKCKQLGWAKELSYFQFANKKLLNPTRILNGLNKITIRDRQGVTIGIGYITRRVHCTRETWQQWQFISTLYTYYTANV